LIYLDNNATTQIDPAVAEVMLACLSSGPLNPSSQHAIGRAARRQLDDAISAMGQLLGADVDSPGGDQWILTSGGSESNNLAISGIGDLEAPLVVSAIEHPSVLAVASAQQSAGREVRIIAVHSDGTINLTSAEQVISQLPRPSLVAVMSANNETGVLQPLTSVAALCRENEVAFHIDATQTIGKLPFDFATSGATSVAFTAHKFHGPAGIGGLIVRSGTNLRPLMHGGEQQLAKRPGTESVALAVGMAKALQIAMDGQQARSARLQTIRDEFEARLIEKIPLLVIHGAKSPRLPGTSCFSLPGVDRQTMLMALDLAGIACSSGSACASGSSRPSHVLQAMQTPEAEIDSALRVGFSKFSTVDEATQAGETICRQYLRLRKFAPVENLG
jgi:cysteine desulfurase